MTISGQSDSIPFEIATASEAYAQIVEGVRFRLNIIDWEAAGVPAEETEARTTLYDAIMPTILGNSSIGSKIGIARRVGEPEPDEDRHGHPLAGDEWFYVEDLPISGEKATYLRNWLWILAMNGTQKIMGADKAKVAAMVESNFGNTWRQAIVFVRDYRTRNMLSGPPIENFLS